MPQTRPVHPYKGTRAVLDITRNELVEPMLHIYRKSSEMVNELTSSKAFKWPGTDLWTLRPVGLSQKYLATWDFDALKFGLSVSPSLMGVKYWSDWWEEVPHYVNGDDRGNFFLHTRVTKDNTDTSKRGVLWLMPSLHATGEPKPMPRAEHEVSNFPEDDDVFALESWDEMPKNQAFVLRYECPGMSSTGDQNPPWFMITFYFGEYAVAIHGNDYVGLYYTKDYNRYVHLRNFLWRSPVGTRQFSNTMLIVPHGRDRIEFLGQWVKSEDSTSMHTRTARQGPAQQQYSLNSFSYRAHQSSTIDNATGEYVITQARPWRMRISKSVHCAVQVGKLAYYQTASIADKDRYLGFAPLENVYLTPEIDSPLGCGVSSQLMSTAPGPPAPWASNGINHSCRAIFTMTGKGDMLVGPGDGAVLTLSSKTPELRGYTIYKPETTVQIARTPAIVHVREVRIDSGDSPESQSLTLTLDNSLQQVEQFKARADIPLRVEQHWTNQNGSTGTRTLFEGVSFRTRYLSSPAQGPETLEIEARGMGDRLLRARWSYNRPDFGFDWTTPDQAWLWQDAVFACFMAAGFTRNEVLIEDPDNATAAAYNFRLWREGSTFGSGVGQSVKGSGLGDRWWPVATKPVYEFTDYLIRQILGWNFRWDLSDHKWHVFKRPTIAEAVARVPKVAFFSNQTRLAAGAASLAATYPTTYIPCYLMRNFGWEAIRAEYNTLIAYTVADRSDVITTKEFTDWYDKAVANPEGTDGAAMLGNHAFTKGVWINCKSFPNPKNPHPDQTHVDFHGYQRPREIALWQACTKKAFAWIGRRFFEDLCFGNIWASWEADWGDDYTYNLKQWDKVLLDMAPYMLGRIEPHWTYDTMRRAKWRASMMRYDAAVPRSQ